MNTKDALDTMGPTFEAYHDGHDWWSQDDYGIWHRRSEKHMRRELLHAGFCPVKLPNESQSALDEYLREKANSRMVQFVGSLAGCDVGMHEIRGRRILVTDTFQLIEAKRGEWPLIREVLQRMLDSEGIRQSDYLYSWLSIAIKALRARKLMPGQTFCFVGPAESGKSLVQKITTKVLGGRSASPFRYMTEQTPFNKELFGAEHLCIEDQAGKLSHQERRTLGDYVKQFAINEEQSCHPKGRDAFTLTPFWRVSISCNDCGENLHALPPLDPGILDKIIICKCARFPMPMDTSDFEKREAFNEAWEAELPAFMWFLEHEWAIPAEIKGGRCGMQAFQHPDIAHALNEGASETHLLELIDQTLFEARTEPWMGKANELESLLYANPSILNQLRRLLTWPNAMGTFLGKLRRDYPGRIEHGPDYSAKHRWIIRPPAL